MHYRQARRWWERLAESELSSPLYKYVIFCYKMPSPPPLLLLQIKATLGPTRSDSMISNQNNCCLCSSHQLARSSAGPLSVLACLGSLFQLSLFCFPSQQSALLFFFWRGGTFSKCFVMLANASPSCRSHHMTLTPTSSPVPTLYSSACCTYASLTHLNSFPAKYRSSSAAIPSYTRLAGSPFGYVSCFWELSWLKPKQNK